MIKAKDILTSAGKFKITLGLERIEKILKLLGNPQNAYKVIHIAGTNGKGSTSKIINDVLIEHFKGEKNIGLFTSPHLFSYTERIKINNEEISDNIFDRLIFQINDLASKNDIDLSEFELITAAAFYYFYIKKADYVILEVGLGGLYDATNVIKKPYCSIITTIDFDHTERLGSTIAEIATQKAGIIKKNCPIVIAKSNLGFETIKNKALEIGAKLIEVEEIKIEFNKINYALINDKKYEFSLLGAHQGKNLALALACLKLLKVSEKTLKKALKNVTWKYRLDYDKKKNLLIDSAHNPSGIKSLRTFLDENFSDIKKTIVFGCLKNKDYKAMLKTLLKPDDDFYFLEFDYPAALKAEELPKEFKNKIIKPSEIEDLIKENKDLKVFCGSIYMLGKIFSEKKY